MKQFGCFQLDIQNGCLWRNGERIPLTPKPFAVLRYLVENPRRLVTHDELLEALWPETYVQPQVLRTYVLELRKVFGDDAGNARFIETVPKRGYRFIAPLAETSHTAGYEKKPGLPQSPELPGRAAEFGELTKAMDTAIGGDRQLIFITGEVGIGKTALVDAFCRRLGGEGQTQIARGQSVEGFGGKEPYYPVMEALTQLCTDAGEGRNLRILQQKAPNWHARLPVVMTSEMPSHSISTIPVDGMQPDRMLGEICDAIESIATETPLILVFEDLHWADNSTLDLISALARRRAQAKLMLIVTYRPADVSDSQHPLKGLKQDLVTRKLGCEMALRPLERTAVAEYLARELHQNKLPAGLAAFLHQHSEGNPLFMIAVLEHLISLDYLRRQDETWQLTTPLAKIDLGVPSALSELIELQIERLDATDQRLLEAASLIGIVFPAWAAAAALKEDLEEIEDQYEKLTRRLHFLHPAGHDELPDGTQSAFYVFAHGLYREVLYKRQSSSRRARRHLRVAERLLQLFAGREQNIASELAIHFEAAGDWLRAAEALAVSAQAYLRRGDQVEASQRMRQAEKLIENLPEPERVAATRRFLLHMPAGDQALSEALSA
ncbi:Adenylate cyclase [Acidisarcina polymorpha]|uniref:Adenylate cyclase n=1 Tax=Acidisarcina polymorpha TaxID=2211140 RepID=A0A2Z5G1Y8_9BACT|nr:AAA family ATPase [Acidisarcina polymorpha]AXC13088.1 Adenylate cyclase [Acidisarcina polymorpha]